MAVAVAKAMVVAAESPPAAYPPLQMNLYRGIKNGAVPADFFPRGGTECVLLYYYYWSTILLSATILLLYYNYSTTTILLIFFHYY